MAVQPRVAKVLTALLISMTAGTIILMAMQNSPPPAGAFCLTSYYRLTPVNKALKSDVAQSQDRWNNIEIYYSQTKAGNIKQLTALAGLSNPEDINCHFVICNGLGGRDGLIQTTEKWKRQWSIIPAHDKLDSGQTIRICIIADGKDAKPTDVQVKRTKSLTEEIHRKFDIELEAVRFPENW